MSHTFTKIIPNETEMLAFGGKLAQVCGQNALIFLQGDLGAGKTTLTRGFLQGLGYLGKVKSPTYTLVESYGVADQKLYHFDFYRLNDPRELEFMGWTDYYGEQALILIEWPERAAPLLPQADLSCYIVSHLTGRQLRLEAYTQHGRAILKDFTTRYDK